MFVVSKISGGGDSSLPRLVAAIHLVARVTAILAQMILTTVILMAVFLQTLILATVILETVIL